jgi:hypothetical protein
MNRRDYDLIAKVFRDAERRCTRGLPYGEPIRRSLAMAIADELAGERGAGGFKRDAFLEACKVPHD